MQPITVIKRDLTGAETWRYEGRVVRREARQITIEARFNRDDTPFHEISLLRGDRFVETFYADRWYNIFKIYDRDDGRLKGWYCNISYPAVIRDQSIDYVDLALDLLVYPDGRQVLLDEDEFAELPLGPEDREKARQALSELRNLAQTFDQASR